MLFVGVGALCPAFIVSGGVGCLVVRVVVSGLPLGLTGAPAQNDYGEVVHRLPKLLPWIEDVYKRQSPDILKIRSTLSPIPVTKVLPPKKFIFRCLPITMPIPELSINVIPEKSNINVLTFPFSICKSTTLLICPAV